MSNEEFINMINEAIDKDYTEKDLFLPLSDLNLDSLDIMTISLAIEEKFNSKISNHKLEGVKKLIDLKIIV